MREEVVVGQPPCNFLLCWLAEILKINWWPMVCKARGLFSKPGTWAYDSLTAFFFPFLSTCAPTDAGGQYFPKALPYISLFPPEPLADDRAAEQARIRGELAEARVDEIAVGFDFEQEGYKKAPRKDSARGGGAGRRNNDRHAASDRRGNSEGGTRTERRRRQARSTDTADDAFFLANGVAPVVEYGRRATQDRPRGKFSTPRPAAARQSEPEERSATKPVARRGDGGSGRKRGADKAGHPEDDDPMAKKQKVTGKLDSIDLSARASGAMVFGDSDSDSS